MTLREDIKKYKKVFRRVGPQTKAFVITVVIQFVILEALAWTNFFQYLFEKPDDAAFKGGPEHDRCATFDKKTDESDRYKGQECLLVYETTSISSVIAAAFMLYLALHGIFKANLPELMAFMSASTLLTASAIIVLAAPGRALDWFYYVLCGSILLGEVIYLGLIYPVYNEYKWELFKRVGGDAEYISVYNNVQRWKAVMKLSLCIGIILVVTSGVFSPIDQVVDIAVTVAGAVVILVIFQAVGHVAVAKENRVLMGLFVFLHLGVPAFIGVKIWLFYYSTFTYYILQSYQFLMAAAVALVLHVITFIFSILCWRNFGRGLTDKRRAASVHPVNWDSIFEETQGLLPNQSVW